MRKLNCLVAGNDDLSIDVMRLLIEIGHEVFGIFTESRAVKDWAVLEKIQLFSMGDLGKNDFENVDYLFCVDEELLASSKLQDIPIPVIHSFNTSIVRSISL